MTWAIPARANIYDRDGLGLAYEGTNVTLGVIPGQIADEAALLKALSQVTGLATNVVKSRYANAAPTWYVPITDVPGDTYIQNRALLDALPGFQARSKTVRTYRPDGVAAHTIGYIGVIPQAGLDIYRSRGYRGDEWVGLVGLEKWGEKYLAGTHGGQLDIVNAKGELGLHAGERRAPSSAARCSLRSSGRSRTRSKRFSTTPTRCMARTRASWW